jgi:predicted MFS family arabinose efflux permease
MLALVLTGGASLPLLALIGFAGGCGTIAFQVAAPALVPSLVPAEVLPRANARVELARTVAFTAGPALAGVIVGRTGAPPAFGVAAALSLCAVLLLGGLPEPTRRSAPRRNPLSEIGEGLRFVACHRLLLPVLVVQLIFNTAWFVIQAAYTPYAVHHLHLAAAGVGATLAVYGAGLLIGVLLAPRVMRSLPFGVAIGTGPVCGLVAGLIMVATIALPSFLLAGLSFLLLGVGPALWIVSTTTLRQRITPPGMLGRVSAVFLVASGSRSLGTALVALVGSLLGAGPCLEMAAAGFGLQALLILLSPAVRMVSLPEPAPERVAA